MDLPSQMNQAAKRPTFYILLLVPTLLITPVLFHQFSSQEERSPHNRSPDNRLFDIDIGTNGRIMKSSATTIITFDPSDKLIITPELESYPFGIADFNGNATFYYNKKTPACSSLNIRNEYYNTTIRDEHIARRCGGKRFEGNSYHCQHYPDLETMTVPVRSLSSFLKERGVNRVNKLKIDAQGSDFAIIKDFFENLPNVNLNYLMFECQDYDQGVPLYFSPNDCSQVIEYLKNRFPNLEYRKDVNNCLSAEYNINIDFSKF